MVKRFLTVGFTIITFLLSIIVIISFLPDEHIGTKKTITNFSENDIKCIIECYNISLDFSNTIESMTKYYSNNGYIIILKSSLSFQAHDLSRYVYNTYFEDVLDIDNEYQLYQSVYIQKPTIYKDEKGYSYFCTLARSSNIIASDLPDEMIYQVNITSLFDKIINNYN